MMPRFRGRAFETNGFWSWEIFVSILGDNENIFDIQANKVFPTKELALEDLKIAVKKCCDIAQETIMGKSNGEYIDLKTNETLKWDTSSYN